jgi:HEXXH motif-containing protein
MAPTLAATQDPEPVHRLSSRQFDSLTLGAGDGDALRQLVRAEHSYRLLFLDLVMDMIATREGVARPLPDPQRAWDLLAAAQRKNPAAVGELLDLPETGLWAGQLLERLCAPRPGELPLWADVGHLHCLAAAAAVRAGLDFSLPVPCLAGRVELPTLGQVRLPHRSPIGTASLAGRGGAVTVTSDTGSVRLPQNADRPAPGWHPAHRGEVRLPGSAPVRFLLDDFGRHRIAPPPVGAVRRLTPEAAADLAELVRRGCELLVETDPASAATVTALLRTVQPMPAHEVFRVRSASSGHAVGGLALSRPDSETACAAALAHELQHSKLNALAHLVPLSGEREGPGRLYYAPWRDDPRPLSGMLHGIYAFSGVARFWRGRAHRARDEQERLAWFEFALWRDQLAHVLPEVAADRELTAVGRRLLEGVRATVAGWSAESPHGGAARAAVRLAERLAADHRALWRLHHVRSRPEDTERLAAAWPSHTPPALSSRRLPVRARRGALHLDARAVLARTALADPAALNTLRDITDEDGVPGVTGAGRADLLWAAGDPAAATEHYLRSLADNPTAPSAWAGLRLSLEETGRSPDAVHALTTVPETVSAVARAVHRRTGTPADPVELAQWMGRGLSGTA